MSPVYLDILEGSEDEHDWVDLAPYWEQLRAIARSRNAQKRNYGSSRYWNRDPHFLGLCGERVWASLTGQEMDLSLKAKGDGGVDFYVVARLDGGELVRGRLDIKATEYIDDPWLRLPVSDALRADWYGLAAIDVPGLRGYWVGVVTRRVVLDADQVDLGYGPTRVVRPDDFAASPVRLGGPGLLID